MTAEAPSWLTLQRRVRFSDTDAAGVVHFQQLLGWCHQAWEESLEAFGLEAGSIFPGGRRGAPSVALPIVHCHADFRAPLQVGDALTIELSSRLLGSTVLRQVISAVLPEDQRWLEVASAASSRSNQRSVRLPKLQQKPNTIRGIAAKA